MKRASHDGCESYPIIRAVRVGNEPVDVCFDMREDGQLWWHRRPAADLRVRSSIAGFRFTDRMEVSMTQVTLNVLMFNSLRLKEHDSVRLVSTTDTYTLFYYMRRGEVITVPRLPSIPGTTVAFVRTEDGAPALKIVAKRADRKLVRYV